VAGPFWAAAAAAAGVFLHAARAVTATAAAVEFLRKARLEVVFVDIGESSGEWCDGNLRLGM
jgi:hypothetical protein